MNAFNDYFDMAHHNMSDIYYENPNDYIATPTKEITTAWIVSSFLFACVVGAGIFSVVSDTLGRKISIIIGGVLFAIGGLVQALANGYAMLLVGRSFSGLSIGTLSMVSERKMLFLISALNNIKTLF
jgi:MFS family permease